jgi:hypothetical protein
MVTGIPNLSRLSIARSDKNSDGEDTEYDEFSLSVKKTI